MNKYKLDKKDFVLNIEIELKKDNESFEGFGFKHGDRFKTKLGNKGFVIGVYNKIIYVQYDNVLFGKFEPIRDISFISKIECLESEIINIKSNGNSVNVDVSPWAFVKYNFKPGDNVLNTYAKRKFTVVGISKIHGVDHVWVKDSSGGIFYEKPISFLKVNR